MIDNRLRRPVFASGSGGFGGTPQAATQVTVMPPIPPPTGFTTTPGPGLVPQTFTDANGVQIDGFAPSFAPADIAAAAAAAISPAAAAAATPNASPASPVVPPVLASAVNASGQTQTAANVPAVTDFRIRLSPLVTATAFAEVLGPPGDGNLLNPLYATSGMLFPYTPQITVAQDVSYQDVAPVHSNMDYMAYTRTPSVTISISGKWTVQNQIEGVYALACLHFLRTVSKMYFGETANDPIAIKKRGTPPPILVLRGYGSYMFNNLRVILKSHTYTFNETMDTVLVTTAGGTARLPALFDIALTLVVQQTPNVMRKEFNLDQFRTGALLRQGGWI